MTLQELVNHYRRDRSGWEYDYYCEAMPGPDGMYVMPDWRLPFSRPHLRRMCPRTHDQMNFRELLERFYTYSFRELACYWRDAMTE